MSVVQSWYTALWRDFLSTDLICGIPLQFRKHQSLKMYFFSSPKVNMWTWCICKIITSPEQMRMWLAGTEEMNNKWWNPDTTCCCCCCCYWYIVVITVSWTMSQLQPLKNNRILLISEYIYIHNTHPYTEKPVWCLTQITKEINDLMCTADKAVTDCDYLHSN